MSEESPSLLAYLDARIAQLKDELAHEAHSDEVAEYKVGIHELELVKQKAIENNIGRLEKIRAISEESMDACGDNFFDQGQEDAFLFIIEYLDGKHDKEVAELLGESKEKN